MNNLRARSVALLGAALLADAAIETVRAGSAVRWWAVAAALLYIVATAATWRRSIGWRGRASVGLVTLLGLLAATAFLAGGLVDGVRFVGQPTTTVLAGAVAAGIAAACIAVSREPRIPWPLRSMVVALAAYGVVALLAGAIGRTPLVALLAGASVWQRLPSVLQGAFVGGFLVLPAGIVVAAVRAGLRRPSETSVHAEVWRLTAIATSFAIVLAAMPRFSRSSGALASTAGTATPFGSSPPRRTAAEIDAALANSLRAVEDGEREAPRDRWDPAYVAARVGPDPRRLFEWVRGSTFWIPYRGALRGAVGVLMDRSGNSLDRAVLLATLVTHARGTARLAHGSLPREAAVKLLPRLISARARGTAAAQYRFEQVSLTPTLAAQSDALEKTRAQLQARVPGQAQRLAAAIGQRPNDDLRARFERAIDALQDHWWVQVRDGEAWRDLDLLGRDGAALVSPIETIDPDAVPDALRHQLIVRVVVEQWSAGALTERVALEQPLRPSELVGVPLSLQFTPLRAPTQPPPTNLDSLQGLRTAALAVHEWVPVLMIGGNQVAQSALLDTGDLAKPGAEELVRQSGRDAAGFAKAAGDLFNPGGPAPATPSAPPSKILSAAWIDYEIRVPGSPTEKIRRPVFDLVGASARGPQVPAPRVDETATLTRSLALMMGTEILPIVSRFAPQYLVHLAGESLLANREILGLVARGALPDDFARAEDLSKRIAPMPTPLYGLARARLDWSRHSREIFIDRPNILTRHVFFSPAPAGLKLQDATDIVANEVGVDPLASDAFAIRLEQGVFDTNAEALLRSDRPDAANAGSAFESAATWTALTSATDPRLASLRVPDDVRRRMADDLAAGYVVVAPAAPVPTGGDAFVGWWRVDPQSGHALGMGRTGWGAAIVERALILLTGAATAFLFAYLWCAGRAGSTDSAAIDYLIVPVRAAGSACLADAVSSAVFAFLAGLVGGLFGGGGSSRPGAGRGAPGGAAEPGAGGEPPPTLDKSGPGLADTLPGDPPPPRPPPPGNQPPGSGRGSGGAVADPDEAAMVDAERRYWDAQARGDDREVTEAIRDMARISYKDDPNALKAIPPRGEPPGAQWDERPTTSPGAHSVPPCGLPPCSVSPTPMTKSIDGIGGTLDVVNASTVKK